LICIYFFLSIEYCFGLFIGLAMIIVLLTALALLPWLIMQVKPFGIVQKGA